MTKSELADLKVAVIGAGYTAREHIKAFSDIGGVSVDGIFSRTREKAEKLAAEFGIRNVCSSLEELREKTGAGIVVVTVNELSMPGMIENCLRHDWEIFAEKPPALRVEEAQELQGSAGSKGKEIRVAMNRASYSVTRKVSSELASVEGKRVVIVQDQEDPERALQLGRPPEVADRWMYANSIHMVDYFRIFARGEAKKVHVSGGLHSAKPCFVEARIEFDSGDLGVYHAFWNEPAPWAVTVQAPDVRYEIRPLEECKRQARLQKAEPIEADEWDRAFKPGFRRQAEEMVNVARTGQGEVPTLGDAVKTMKLIREIYKR